MHELHFSDMISQTCQYIFSEQQRQQLGNPDDQEGVRVS